MISQWFFYAVTSIVKFCFWAGLLYCACKWIPIAWKIATDTCT